MERLPRNAEWRKRLRNVITRVGHGALQGAQTMDETALHEVKRRFGPRDDNYSRLALWRYMEFNKSGQASALTSRMLPDAEMQLRNRAREAVTNDDASVRHGFMVCGWLLGYSVQAYLNFCRTRQFDPSKEELAAILKRRESIDNTVLKLALLPAAKNGPWEDTMGLYDSGYYPKPGYAGPLEVATVQREPTLKFNLPILIAAIQTAPSTNDEAPHEHCPAYRFLPMLWSSMVDESVQNPALFDASFAEYQAAAVQAAAVAHPLQVRTPSIAL